MRLINDQIFRKAVMMVGAVSFLSIVSQVAIAEDFVKVNYEGRQVVWDLALPEGATGVMARVLFTPNDLKADSYLEEVLFEEGRVVYPFNGELEDGTYTWELRLLHKDAKAVGFKPSSKAEEGPIDGDGRQIELVGEPLPAPKGKIRVSNTGRDSVQNGGFRVVKGEIPDFGQVEEVGEVDKVRR